MHTPNWSPRARAEYDRLRDEAAASLNARRQDPNLKPTAAEGLFKQVRKCVEHLLNNPRHPGLQTHKYESLAHPWDQTQPVFEAYVQNHTPGAYRLFWCYGPKRGEITLIAITPHP